MMMCNQKLKYEKHYIPCKQQLCEVWIHTHSKHNSVLESGFTQIPTSLICL